MTHKLNEYRYILHADLDAFYASVEQTDNLELKGKPVVVGAPPEARGVVAAASYEAREFGIHSAMPMRTAIGMCHNLIRVSPRFHRYREVSQKIMGYFREVTHLIEPLSLDEAYIDISDKYDYEKVAKNLKNKVKQMTDLNITIGGGTSKTVSKIACQVSKPNGLLLINAGEELEFLSPLKVSIITGVGPKTRSLLNSYGIETLQDLASCNINWLIRMLGSKGYELKNKAMGIDEDPVPPFRKTKSISTETTLVKDIFDQTEMHNHIRILSHKISRHLMKAELKGRTIKLKLRLSDFTTFVRQSTLGFPTDNTDVIYKVIVSLFARENNGNRSFRLIGIGVSNFSDTSQMPLFTDVL